MHHISVTALSEGRIFAAYFIFLDHLRGERQARSGNRIPGIFSCRPADYAGDDDSRVGVAELGMMGVCLANTVRPTLSECSGFCFQPGKCWRARLARTAEGGSPYVAWGETTEPTPILPSLSICA